MAIVKRESFPSGLLPPFNQFSRAIHLAVMTHAYPQMFEFNDSRHERVFLDDITGEVVSVQGDNDN